MKYFKIILTVIVLLLTVLTCSLKPALHKPFVITAENFKLERYTEKTSDSNVKLAASEYGSSREVKIDPSVFLAQQHINIASEEVPVKEQVNQIDSETPKTEDVVKEIDDTEIKEPPVKKLTRKEEIIAWNKWRSDLQNKIMLDSEVTGTLGTTYYFSFKVDKFRHISNINAFTTNPMFQKEVNEKLIPCIKKLEYTPILEFPKGSARESTKFKGMFVIWDETSFASPNDFSDYERVNVYE